MLNINQLEHHYLVLNNSLQCIDYIDQRYYNLCIMKGIYNTDQILHNILLHIDYNLCSKDKPHN